MPLSQSELSTVVVVVPFSCSQDSNCDFYVCPKSNSLLIDCLLIGETATPLVRLAPDWVA